MTNTTPPAPAEKRARFRPDRLLNVAKALRESKTPRKFTMEFYGHDCGTPACAFGHYASRTDLQRAWKLNEDGNPVYRRGPDRDLLSGYDDATNHFGIDPGEADEVFGVNGCGRAKTTKSAALYIERFVARKLKELGR